jgi:hypothetical protein
VRCDGPIRYMALVSRPSSRWHAPAADHQRQVCQLARARVVLHVAVRLGVDVEVIPIAPCIFCMENP